MPLVIVNLIRCALVAAIVALPPTAGCRNWYKATLSVATTALPLTDVPA